MTKDFGGIIPAKSDKRCHMGFQMFGEITKTIEQEDGTLIVQGIASTETPDSVGDIVTSAAMKAAIPDYMRFGAVREMHQPLAAGTALSCDVGDDGITRLEALVVDPVSIKKVQTGVLKGFSIGGSIPKDGRNLQNKKQIDKLKLTEISLVDRPANPDATFTLAKFQEEPMTDEPKHESLRKWAGEEIGDARLAISCLSDLFYLFAKESVEGEADQASDLEIVVGKLKAFISKEIMEDNMTKPEGAGINLAEDAEPIAKAGAKYSKATKEAVRKLRGAIAAAQDCMKAFDDVADEDDDKEKDEDEEKVSTKADTSEPLAKSESMIKIETENADLREKLAKAEAALLTKGALKVVPVSKEADTSTEKISKAEDSTKPLTPIEAMRKVHQNGGRLLTTSNINRLG